MKKSIFVLMVAAVMSFACVFAGCASTSSSTTTKEGEEVTIVMHDNCPTDNAGAILAKAGIKAVDGSYSEETSFTFVGSPDASSIKPILTYTTRCRSIQQSIKSVSDSKTCTLEYNTKKDGTGITLDLSSSNAIILTLAKMIDQNATTIYAIYKY